MANSSINCFKHSSCKNLFEKPKKGIKKVLKVLGPGFITGAADDDPSGIGTYSVAGAQYGPLLLWLIPLQLPLMFAIQEMCGRIGLVTGKGLAANMKLHFPKSILYGSIFILVLANVINIGADISIMAASLKLVLGFNINFWALTATIVIILMEIFISYHTYSKILLILSAFLLSYAITALMTTEQWLEILWYTFTPHILWNKDFFLVATGFIGTTISPYLFFWQTSQEIEEKLDHKTKRQVRKIIKEMPKDTFSGMFFSQLMTLFIVLTCYFSLHQHGITHITSAYEAALALKPFAGECASIVFALGIIGAGFLGIPVLAGSSAYALSEVFNQSEGLAYKFHEAKFFYGVIAFSTLIGLFINFIGINPIQGLLYAAVINCIAAVPLIGFILILGNKKELMGQSRNRLFSNIFGSITLILMLLSALMLIVL
jgi:NRAMP (natural resistance-associated macrophage protein)-like metal ion transporter